MTYGDTTRVAPACISFVRALVLGAGDDQEVGFELPGGEHDVDVVLIARERAHQTASASDTRRQQDGASVASPSTHR